MLRVYGGEPTLNVQVSGNDVAKATSLRDFKLFEILRLGFSTREQFKKGTIESWVMGHESQQLRGYVTSTTVKQLLKERSLELRAHLVIIVGLRHILLWDIDKEGELATKPRLVKMLSRSKRQDS